MGFPDCLKENIMNRSICAAVAVFTVCFALPATEALAANCRDPWVTKAVTQVQGRAPNGSGDSGECDYRRYGGGKWTTYDDLLGKVRTTFGKSIAPPISGLAKPAGTVASPAGSFASPPPGTTLSGAKPVGAGIVANNGSRVIGQNGAGIVANNGSRIVTDNGAGVVGQNGANVIGQNGANMRR